MKNSLMNFPSKSKLNILSICSSVTYRVSSLEMAISVGHINSPSPLPYLPNSPVKVSSPCPSPSVIILTRAPTPVLFHGTLLIVSAPRFITYVIPLGPKVIPHG